MFLQGTYCNNKQDPDKINQKKLIKTLTMVTFWRMQGLLKDLYFLFRRVQKKGFNKLRRDRKHLEDRRETSKKQEINVF